MQSKSVFSSFFSGYATALKYPGLILAKWWLNILFAACVLLSFGGFVFRNQPDSLSLTEKLSVTQVAEFLQQAMPHFEAVTFSAVAWVLFFLLISVGFNGGIIKVYQSRQRQKWSQFTASCVRYFPSMLVISIFTLILAALIYEGMVGVLYMIDIAAKATGSPSLEFFASGLLFLVILLLWSWLTRVYDVARILACEACDRRPIRAFIRSIGFVRRHHIATFGIWLLYTLVLILINLGYLWSRDWVEIQGPKSLWITIGVGQLLILTRAVNAMASWAGFNAFLSGRFESSPLSPNLEPQAPRQPMAEQPLSSEIT